MKQRTRQRLLMRFQNLLFYLLLAAFVGLAGWLSDRYTLAWDWSAGARNSLSEVSQQLLERLESPLQIVSFSPENPELRRQISEIVARYQRYSDKISLEFVNPDTQPDLVRQLGIRVTGELRLTYQGRSENLRTITEETLSNTIQRLLQQREHWISILEGHGERSFSGSANHDLGRFGQELQRKGYHIQPLDLATSVDIPHNTAVLVIAGPQVEYRPDELSRIAAYVKGGGNLLWLQDPGSLHGLKPLMEQLGLSLLPGTVVDANAATLGLESPAMALVPRYPDHPVTRDFELVTVYPHAAALEYAEAGPWKNTPLLNTLSRSWNETGLLQGEIERNEEQGERAGPLTIGVTLEREIEDRQQRILVIGDGDFLSNSFLGNSGNLDLGLNIFRWLSDDDQLLNIPARTAPDRNLQLSPTAGAVISMGFLFMLPLLFLAAGLLIWWRRRNL
jgi:ABC-type uncharacterized transport system involved in gliding motility auxiliary subunit